MEFAYKKQTTIHWRSFIPKLRTRSYAGEALLAGISTRQCITILKISVIL